MRKLVVSILAGLIAAPAGAVPIVATLGDFTGATVIDSEVTFGTEITNQFAAQGVSFSGGLFGRTLSRTAAAAQHSTAIYRQHGRFPL